MQVAFFDRTAEFNALIFAPRADGLTPTGFTFGMAWGDLNGDSLPDLYINNHDDPLKFLISYNVTSGRFEATTFLPPRGDTHGAAWGDFNNDGLQDLFQSNGANSGTGTRDDLYGNRFFVNVDGVLVEQGALYDVRYPPVRGRQSTWIDGDNDGLLDLFFGGIAREDGLGPSRYLERRGDVFVDSSAKFDIPLEGMDGALAGDFDADGVFDLILSGSFAGRTLHMMRGDGDGGFSRVADAFGNTPGGADRTPNNDYVTGDFNGDGFLDLWVGRSNMDADAALLDATTARLYARVDRNDPQRGFEFTAAGDVSFEITNTNFLPAAFFVGATGRRVAGSTLSLSSEDASVYGRPNSSGLTGPYTLVWRDYGTGAWRVEVDTTTTRALAQMIVRATGGMSAPTLTGDLAPSRPDADILLLNDGQGRFVDASAAAGLLAQPFATDGLAVGDFDNDRDLDVYAQVGGPAGLRPNVMWRNDGGVFTPLVSSQLGAGTSRGVDYGVTVADFNNDGWLDIVTANGNFNREYAAPGGYEVFENAGGTNSWLKIDLTGVVSNRDGIGATVYVTADGQTQMRQLNGGVHAYVQDSSVLHFGLGAATSVTLIEVRWPSGLVQTLSGVPVNRLLTITEGVSNAPPMIAALAAPEVLEGQTVRLDITAADPEGEAVALSVRVADAVSGAVVDPSRYVFTDNGDGTGFLLFETDRSDAGVYRVTASASDGTGVSSRDTTFTVTDVPDAPLNAVVVRVGGTGTAAVAPRFEVLVDGTSLGAFNVRAPVAVFDPAIDTLFSDFAFDVSGPAPRAVEIRFLNDSLVGQVNLDLWIDYIDVNGVRFETELVATNLFTNPSGPQVVVAREVMYRNGIMLFDELPFTSPVDLAPEIAPVAPLTVGEGALAAFTVQATDPNGDAVSLTATVLDIGAGVALAQSRYRFEDVGGGVGAFEFLPNFTEAGDYRVLVSASDGVNVSTQAVDITVVDVPESTVNVITARVGGTGTDTERPLFAILVDGVSYGTFSVARPVSSFDPANDALFSDFSVAVDGPAPRRVDVAFLNDGFVGPVNRDLWVDYIEVNGQRFESEIEAVSLFTNGNGPQAVTGRETQYRNGTMTFDDLPLT